MKAEVLNEWVTLYEGDCLDVLPILEAGSADAVITDPPYFGVKSDEWDNQWANTEDFLRWVELWLVHSCRLLRTSGSMYVFASADMAGRIESEVSRHFRVINRICWAKPAYSTKAEMNKKQDQRSYFPRSEYVIFAEHIDATALLKKARIASGLSTKELCEAIGAYRSVNCGGAVRNWESGINTPSREQYSKLGAIIDLPPYEDCVRPFLATKDRPYTDVWEYQTVNTYPGKHPCEKPVRMIQDVMLASTNLGGAVLDPFAGSGTTGVAAMLTGRRCILIEKDARYCDVIRRRVERASGDGPGSLFHAPNLEVTS